MRYVVRASVIWLVGEIWQPWGSLCAQTKGLTKDDVENLRDDAGAITRESVSRWLDCNTGDFSRVVDFATSIEDGENTVEISWATEEGEQAWLDCNREYELA